MFRLALDRKIRKNKTTHAIGVSPNSKIHNEVSAGDPLLARITGSHTSRIKKPRAASVATTNFRVFFRMAGPLRSGPRKRPINKPAASHSTGALKNDS